MENFLEKTEKKVFQNCKLQRENYHEQKIDKMEIKNFTITKRDGTKDRFSLDKIMNAIIKAFESVNEVVDLGNVSKLISRLNI